MNELLRRELPGIDWNFSQYIRDNVSEALSGVKGDNSIKIIGPDLLELEKLAEKVKSKLEETDANGNPRIRGMETSAFFTSWGSPTSSSKSIAPGASAGA